MKYILVSILMNIHTGQTDAPVQVTEPLTQEACLSAQFKTGPQTPKDGKVLVYACVPSTAV